MQKKLIALAVAGLASTGAFAQTNVTMYGKIDMSYEASSGDFGTKTSGMNSGGHDGSRLGFRGEEALGGGMKAIFGLEYQLTTDVNSGLGNTTGTNARQTYVGLAGNFGEVKLGRVYSTGDNFGGKYDSLDAANSYSPLQYFAAYFTTASGQGITTGSVSNAIAYKSPAFYDITVRSFYGFGNGSSGQNCGGCVGDNIAYGNTAANNDQQRNYGVGFDYDKGPLSIGFVYSGATNINNDQSVGAGSATRAVTQKDWAVGGIYDFGMAALYGTYQGDKVENIYGTTIAKWEIYSIGATVPVTKADLLRVMYAQIDNKLPGAAGNNRGADSWGVVFEHSLSKRTIAYAGYNYMNNDSATAAFKTTAGNGNAGQSNVLVGVGGSSSGYGFGMIHNF